MTVSTLNITSGPYVGNNLNDTYSYDFTVVDKTQLSVYETTDLGVQTLLVVDTDYTVNNIGVDGGGTLVRLAGNLPTNYQWYIRSNRAENQLTDFSSQGAFFPDIHEAQMDHLTFLIQQLRDTFDRSMKLEDSYSGSLNLTLDAPDAVKYLRWKSDLSGIENIDLATSGVPTNADIITYSAGNNFTGGVNRTQESKDLDIPSVADFGAVGSGDETVKFQAAITASRELRLSNGVNYTVGSLTFAHSVTFYSNGATINTKAIPAISIGKYLPNTRGPLFILSDPSSTSAGEAAGQQILIGDNPTATPAANDFVAQQVIINNLNGRKHLWAQNIGALQDATGTDGMVRAVEFEVAGTFGNAITDPFSGSSTPAYRKNAIEIIGHSGSNGRLTSAATVWVNDSTGVKWWNEGVSLSRCYSNGVHFYKDPGGVTDTVNAFQNAAIFDESNSDSVLKVTGNHTNIIDISGIATLSNFVKMSNGGNQTLIITNGADYDIGLKLDSGSTATKNTTITFSDQGTDNWLIQKNLTNDLNIYDSINTLTAMQFDGDATNSVEIYVGGALKRIEVGAADSGGTGYRALRVLN